MPFSFTNNRGLFGPDLSEDPEDRIARLKQQIGFSDEPVQDADGYWTIGYGERLNDTPGGPKPYATMSEPMADEALRYRVAQDPSLLENNDNASDDTATEQQGDANDEMGINTADNSSSQGGRDSNGDAGCPNGYTVVPMEVTGYSNDVRSTGKRPGDPGYGVAKNGAKAAHGTIAAPIELMGKRIYVPGYGWGTVQDIGGAIKGNRLDLWFPTEAEAFQWGRQKNLNVIICNG